MKTQSAALTALPRHFEDEPMPTATAPDRLLVHSALLTSLSVIDRHSEFDERNTEQWDSSIDVSGRSSRQKTTNKIRPRARILSAAAELFLRHGMARVSVEAIVRRAATNKPTLYRHFVSKDELVAEYLREAAKRVDAYWAKIDTPGSAKALDQLSSWLVEMADGLVDGWSCRLTNAAAELKEKSHPARRVIKAHNAMQRRRLARLCRRAGLRSPSMVADALLLLFDGACVMAPIRDRADLASRFVLLGEAWITAHMIRRNRDQVFWRCNS
jgi:AcrR family transcriptional regulator